MAAVRAKHVIPDARISVLNLPADILANIFSYFEHKRVDHHGYRAVFVEREELQRRYRDARSARLACRIFHNFVSPYIFPILTLRLEKCSLDIMDSISTNPFLLQGVRIVEVATEYWSERFAQDIELFKERRTKDLDKMADLCNYNTEKWWMNGYDSDDESICPLPKRVYEQAKCNFTAMANAWRENSRDPSDSESGTKNIEYKHILEQGHIAFRSKYEEQDQLIREGTFVDAVAKFVSQLPHACHMYFNSGPWQTFNRYHQNPTLALNDTDELSRFLSTPHEWRSIEQSTSVTNHPPSIILGQLPKAIYQRGTKLQGIYIATFPLLDGQYGFHGKPQGTQWDELQTSCKHLRTFSFVTNHKNIRHQHPQGEDKACIDQFFRAMLSSPLLENIWLSFYGFSLNDGRRTHNINDKFLNMEMGSALSTTQYDLLRTAHISNISLRQDELEKFVDGLGDRLQSFNMYNIELSGSWINLMDMLRRKYLTRCLERHCKIAFDALYGGEFGLRPPEEEQYWWDLDWKLPEKPSIYLECEKYISGDAEVTANPLTQLPR